MKKILTLYLSLTCTFAFATSILASQKECEPVLEHAARNIRSAKWAEERTKKAYDFMCKNKDRRSSSSESLTFGLVLEGIPIDVDGDGKRSEAEIKKWCSENASLDNSLVDLSLFESMVFEPSVQAWAECRRYQAYEVNVLPKTSADGTVVDFGIENRSRADLELLAATSSTPTASCNVIGDQKEFPVSLPRNRVVGVQCTRVASQEVLADGREFTFYPDATFSLYTDGTAEPVQISLPAIGRPTHLSSIEARTLEERVRRLEGASAVLVLAHQETLTTARDGKFTKSRRSIKTNPVEGYSLCALSSVSRYGGGSGSCSVSGGGDSGWVLSVSSRKTTTTCTMSCYDLVSPELSKTMDSDGVN